MKKLIESLLTSTAIFLFAVLAFALSAGAVTINVNLGNAGGTNALNGSAYMTGGFA